MEVHALGEHNARRRVRDVYASIDALSKLPLTWAKWASFILLASQLVLNVGSIIYAFAVRKDTAPGDYKWAHSSVVYSEMAVICCVLARTLFRLALLLRALIQEAWAEWLEPGGGYRYRLRVATQLRKFYRTLRYCNFSLLSFLPAMNPLNLLEYCRLLSQYVHNRTYRVVKRLEDYGAANARTRQNVATVVVLIVAAAKLGFQLALSALAVLAVFLKLLQLTFLGNMPLSAWQFTQTLAFVQFLNNMVSLDQSYTSKMKGKYEFIFCGMDAASSTEERRAKAFFEQLSIMLLREEAGSLLRALVVYSNLCSEEINLVFLEDAVDQEWMDKAQLARQQASVRKPKKQDDGLSPKASRRPNTGEGGPDVGSPQSRTDQRQPTRPCHDNGPQRPPRVQVHMAPASPPRASEPDPTDKRRPWHQRNRKPQQPQEQPPQPQPSQAQQHQAGPDPAWHVPNPPPSPMTAYHNPNPTYSGMDPAAAAAQRQQSAAGAHPAAAEAAGGYGRPHWPRPGNRWRPDLQPPPPAASTVAPDDHEGGFNPGHAQDPRLAHRPSSGAGGLNPLYGGGGGKSYGGGHAPPHRPSGSGWQLGPAGPQHGQPVVVLGRMEPASQALRARYTSALANMYDCEEE
ncbi:hypothetical protein HYH03_005294 [Edaphochlamys debaryana]|uniref:Uncharacterized protein n=1 Tax=Edaphochlamys debaryana TaxID=47281 RepID=A0A836C246_9CHLO|nr:hypothetical protein HYH03_005294 [Edaphochlamys debaryana]|eukprot:KAG2496467.1 hypothetical protein HYH03_005294 [Edaphochlamys debaryana]